MIDFRLLRHFWYFLAVAEERHFGKAAKRLGMSQPPLSQQIQVLEKSLGVKLFERSRQGVRLTKEGAEIMGPVQRFMEHAQRLQLEVLDARQGRDTKVTIGAVNAALFDIMPRLTRLAKQRYPYLSLSLTEMDSATALSAVQNGEVDIAFARFDQPVSALEIRPIVKDQLVVVLPIDHPLTRRDRIALSELADENLVLSPRRISPSFFDQIVSACHHVGFSPRIVHEVRTVVSQIAFVGCGSAIGMVPSRSMRFGGGDVVFRPLVETLEVVTIAAAWDPARRKDVVPAIVDIASSLGTEMAKATVLRRTGRRPQPAV
ncbi:MAG: LysR family transcriptional regulator [Pseudolabrys sp.]|nr:LysR family transcriptional regulator [Pseudolabrys sp.]